MSMLQAEEFERYVVFRLGRVQPQVRGPGMVFIWPCIDACKKIDIRTISYSIPSQEILTKDSVTVSVDAVVFYKIKDPVRSITNVADCNHSTRLLAASTLRNVLGTRGLSEIMSDRDSISRLSRSILVGATTAWGVDVERVELTDIRLPLSLQRAMAVEAEADREAKAKIIAAEGEVKASKALAEASRTMAADPFSLQLRYLQSLGTIASNKPSTIVFPFPMDLMKAFSGGSAGGRHPAIAGSSMPPPPPPGYPGPPSGPSGPSTGPASLRPPPTNPCICRKKLKDGGSQ